ncbi:MAG TPA: hypothetical protein DCG19_09805 [Cryomorphaceae bacterium]|nr:hypothetical protein [Owenweeksia sp.]HAD97688.1 hypothetical protein [Cryomorphaceae bacterium]HBF21360.1 hypothetical protein [Cryomorphaceae bacterium]HCQ17465.1 hypothetical protein [Cryomorphaceae bacterium]|tara:strand:- start:1215 stop:3380 length:2166 start_codon:yes stop_codon:yes gene_type:complete
MTDIQDNLPEADGRDENTSGSSPKAPRKPEQAEADRQEEQEELKEPVAPPTPSEAPLETKEEVNEDQALTETKATEGELASETANEPAEAEAEKQEDISELSDEELEGDDDHEEVHSDEDEHDEFAHEELELPDYAEYEPQKLLAEAEKLLKNEPIQRIKEHMDSIRKSFLKQLNEERNDKLQEFLESGGVEIDFEFIQPLRNTFRSVYSEYRSRRKKYYNDLQEKLEHNLKVKKELIEKIREIVTKDESIGDTFKEFNAIQQEWRNTGPVPRNESSDLWRTYHHHVENFYEYIKINKELRDLDFKKNHERKEALIKKAEVLTEQEDVRQAFGELQKLHKQWKNVGPVEREHREPMWERFSEITKKIHDRREEFYESLKGKREELIAQKKELVQKLQDYPFDAIDSHSGWQKAIKDIEAIRQEFRKVGRINHPENDTIWDEFREVLRNFNRKKNGFYKELKREHHENLDKKRALLEIAENLKESEDWHNTTQELKRIQAQWKRIGHVPRSESDKIWKQFRAACNHFFNRLTEHNKDLDKEFEKNLEEKQKILEELKAFKPSGSQKESVNTLKEIINRWKDVGRVPRGKQQIDSDFNTLLDSQFQSIDLDRKESQRIRFENKMNNLADQVGDRSLMREKSQLRKKREEAQKELNQLETNLNFFSSSNPNSPFIKEAEAKVKQQRDFMNSLDDKIKMISVEIRKMQEEPAEGTEGENGETPEN